MPNPLARAVALVRGHPAIAVGASAGAMALIVPAIRARQAASQPSPDAVAAGAAASPISGYGAGLTAGPVLAASSGDLASANLADTIASGNSALLAQLAQIKDAVAASQKPPTPAPPVAGTATGRGAIGAGGARLLGPPTVVKPVIPGTPVKVPAAAVDYAGTLTPFGSRYPSYVHSYAQAAVWISHALANGYRLPKGAVAAPAVPPRK